MSLSDRDCIRIAADAYTGVASPPLRHTHYTRSGTGRTGCHRHAAHTCRASSTPKNEAVPTTRKPAAFPYLRSTHPDSHLDIVRQIADPVHTYPRLGMHSPQKQQSNRRTNYFSHNEDKFYQRENYSPKNVLSFYNYLITPHCPTKPVRTKYPTYRLSDSMLSIVLHCN